MNIKAKVFKREYNNLKGVASITIDDCFIVRMDYLYQCQIKRIQKENIKIYAIH